VTGALPEPEPLPQRVRDGFVVPEGDLWVFGYGSLMWNPGFSYQKSAPALLRGYHRAFCIYSHRHRGTPEQPGLVLGLNRGGACRGIAYRIAKHEVAKTIDELWVREMPRRVYMPRMLRVAVGPESVHALAFVADPRHYAYASRLGVEQTAHLIAHGKGLRGPNVDYLHNTLHHLRELGVRDHALEHLFHLVQGLMAHHKG